MKNTALVTMLLFASNVLAQEVVQPPPAYPPAPPAAPPPAYPPPPVYPPLPPPTVYAPQPVYVAPPPPRNSRYRTGKILTGVGVPLLVLGFLGVLGGIPFLVLTYTETVCQPSPTRSCTPYLAGAYTMLGLGMAMMISGIVLVKIGRIYRISSRFGALEMNAPRLALISDGSGGVGGAAATLDFNF